jgi:hypothetical protein
MALIDEQVNAWLLEKFLNSSDYDKSVYGTAESIKVVTVDMGWECGCYSSWTRDDSFEMVAKFGSDSGTFEWRYGYWADFPSFITDLDEYINNEVCSIENRRDDDEWT